LPLFKTGVPRWLCIKAIEKAKQARSRKGAGKFHIAYVIPKESPTFQRFHFAGRSLLSRNVQHGDGALNPDAGIIHLAGIDGLLFATWLGDTLVASESAQSMALCWRFVSNPAAGTHSMAMRVLQIGVISIADCNFHRGMKRSA
jgi:hypothetical protein